jgi:hypothetical protein
MGSISINNYQKGLIMMKKETLFAMLAVGFLANSALGIDNQTSEKSYVASLGVPQGHEILRDNENLFYVINRKKFNKGDTFNYKGDVPCVVVENMPELYNKKYDKPALWQETSLKNESEVILNKEATFCEFVSKRYGRVNALIKKGDCECLNYADLMSLARNPNHTAKESVESYKTRKLAKKSQKNR